MASGLSKQTLTELTQYGVLFSKLYTTELALRLKDQQRLYVETWRKKNAATGLCLILLTN